MLIRRNDSGYCFIAGFRGQVPILRPNVFLVFTCVSSMGLYVIKRVLLLKN